MNSKTDLVGRKRILIVEDDTFIAQQIKESLMKHGYTISMANNVEDAIEQIKKNDVFDIVIIDLMLPNSNNDFLEIEKNERKLVGISKDLDNLYSKVNDIEIENAILDKRIKRASILKVIDRLIYKEAGINIVQKINTDLKDKKPRSFIFLTAIGDDNIVKKGLSEAGEKTPWLVKPVTIDTILDACNNI
jgi:CheY-like chemotaxis protein